ILTLKECNRLQRVSIARRRATRTAARDVLSLQIQAVIPRDWAGSLAKRTSKLDFQQSSKKRHEAVSERVYVPLEEEARAHDVEGHPVRKRGEVTPPLADRDSAPTSTQQQAHGSQPAMAAIFGPGGFL